MKPRQVMGIECLLLTKLLGDLFLIDLRRSFHKSSILVFFLALLLCGVHEIHAQTPEKDGRSEITIEGNIKAGESFKRMFGPDFIFELRPASAAVDSSQVWIGWNLSILEKDRDVNLAGMTTPWHGPGPLIIFGWNFLPGVNAPREHRTFMFSPEVGQTITWDMVDPRNGSPDYAQVKALLARIERFGRGELDIKKYELTSSKDSISSTGIKWMNFAVRLSWPASYKPQY